MGYYNTKLIDNARNLCTIILTLGKYKYKLILMGVYNPPEVFQEKTYGLFQGLEWNWAYINDLLGLKTGDFNDHLDK